MKHFILVCVLDFIVRGLHAQYTLLPDAVAGTVTLPFTAIISNPGSVVFHPGEDVYYISRCGNATFPLETLTTSGVTLHTTTTGLDTRGVWWNPNTMQVERNCFSSIGWSTIDVNVSGFAVNTYSMLFTGMNQPDVQSVGAYDYQDNEVIFYQPTGTIKRYDRNTAVLSSTQTLTGTSFSTVNTNTVIYTGVSGYEIGLLDWSAKKILLFDGTTGIFAGFSQLPATAVTASTFKFSYANDLVWLFHSADNSWHSYHIWDIALSASSMLVSGSMVDNDNVIDWDVQINETLDHFLVEKSIDGYTFNEIGRVSAVYGDSQYTFSDTDPEIGFNYYRITAIGTDQQAIISRYVQVEYSNDVHHYILYPNPAESYVCTDPALSLQSYILYNELGQVVGNGVSDKDGLISVVDLPPGTYLLKTEHMAQIFIRK